MIAVLVPIVALLCLWAATRPEPLPRASDLLQQIHTAFEMYAEDFDGKYPPMSAKPGEFVPDVDAFGPYLARLPEGDLLSAYLTGKCGVQLCYIGYLLPNQPVTVAFLDEYEERGSGILGNESVSLQAGGVGVKRRWELEPWSWKTVYRLREGTQRFLVTQISNPIAGKQAKAWVPMLWEMADTTRAAGGWVLYMDGHTEWLPYGSFPMTGKIVTRLRDFVAPPAETPADREPRVDSRPALQYRWTKRHPSPVHQLAADVADSLPLACYKLVHCDTTPSVSGRGYRIQFTSGVQVVLFPADTEVDSKFKYRIWPKPAQDERKAVAYLGTGHGYRWFARATPQQLDDIRMDFALAGGDDRLQLMIDTNGFDLMPRLGERAVPYLESVVTNSEQLDHVGDALIALDQIECARSREVIRAALATDNENALRNATALAKATASFPAKPRLNDSTIDAVVKVYLARMDPRALAETARYYTQYPGKVDTSQVIRIGNRILEGLRPHPPESPLESLGEDGPS
jgi:hypothetical protein